MNECQLGGTLAASLGLRMSGNGARAKVKSHFLDLETKSIDDAFMELHSWKDIWDILDESLYHRSQPLLYFLMAFSA